MNPFHNSGHPPPYPQYSPPNQWQQMDQCNVNYPSPAHYLGYYYAQQQMPMIQGFPNDLLNTPLTLNFGYYYTQQQIPLIQGFPNEFQHSNAPFQCSNPYWPTVQNVSQEVPQDTVAGPPPRNPHWPAVQNVLQETSENSVVGPPPGNPSVQNVLQETSKDSVVGPPPRNRCTEKEVTVIRNTVNFSHTVPTGPIEVELTEKKLWEDFDKIPGGNEMLVNIHSRHLFPRLQFNISNLSSSKFYIIGLKFRRINSRRMTYSKSQGWSEIPESENPIGDVPLESEEVLKPVQTGEALMRCGVDWSDLQLQKPPTRSTSEEPSLGRKRKAMDGPLIQVSTQCIYMPIIIIYEVIDASGAPPKQLHEFSFDNAKFHVVTEYKSTKVRCLKAIGNKHTRLDTKEMMRRVQENMQSEQNLEESTDQRDDSVLEDSGYQSTSVTYDRLNL